MTNAAAELQRILRERAAVLAAPQSDERAVELVELIVFAIAGARYAVDAVEVKEAIAISRVTLLPGVPAFYRGLVIHQGIVYPLIDVGLLVGAAGGTDTLPAHALLFASNERTIAIAADAIEAFVRIEAAGILPASDRDDKAAASIRGVTSEGIAVLDVHVLFADARLVVDDRTPVPDQPALADDRMS